MAELHGWTSFFEQVSTLAGRSEVQFGIANYSYCEYVIERLELCITTCSGIVDLINTSSVELELSQCISLLSELLKCLRTMLRKWEEYKSTVEQSTLSVSHPDIIPSLRRGRPLFNVSRSQIEYLSSLSFKWTEIAAILGVSRMTLYRLVVVI